MKKKLYHLCSSIAFATFIFIAFGSGDDKKSNSITENVAKSISVGQTLQTDYFEVTVNKVSFEERISTGNQFADLKRENGSLYLVLNVTFKNTDAESRMLTDGEILINYNGKDYLFDKSETIMLEGWGVLLDQINPLTSKTTNLVYKIPTEIKGNLFYRPGRAGSDDLISLGKI